MCRGPDTSCETPVTSELMNRRQHCVVDVTGDFTGLIFQNAVSGPRVKEFRINSLTPMTPEPEAESCPVREWLRSCELHGGSFIDPCGLGTLMPEEETESPEEVRSQRRRSLPNADE